VLRKSSLAVTGLGLLLVAAGCGGGGVAAGTQDATATTFATDRAVVSALTSMLSDASGAALFTAAGAGGPQAGDCATTWLGIRDRVAKRDASLAAAFDGAVAQLQAAAVSRDVVGATAAAATIGSTAAAYTRQFP
jgi:hypothetical protein